MLPQSLREPQAPSKSALSTAPLPHPDANPPAGHFQTSLRVVGLFFRPYPLEGSSGKDKGRGKGEVWDNGIEGKKWVKGEEEIGMAEEHGEEDGEEGDGEEKACREEGGDGKEEGNGGKEKDGREEVGMREGGGGEEGGGRWGCYEGCRECD